MTTANYTMHIAQGSDFSLLVTLKEKDTQQEIDLTGYVFSGQIRKTISDEEVQASFQFEVRDQSLHTGQFYIKLPASASTAIELPNTRCTTRPITKMVYDIESDNNGSKKRWLEGVVEISPEVTRE